MLGLVVLQYLDIILAEEISVVKIFGRHRANHLSEEQKMCEEVEYDKKKIPQKTKKVGYLQ